MKRHPVAVTWLWSSLVTLCAVAAYGQSLTDKLDQEEGFYRNYGREPYAKLKMEKDVVGHYDDFGEHIVDGVYLYGLTNSDSIASKSGQDSVIASQSNEYGKNDFYEKFSNLVVTQDAIGGVKTSFLVGDQIATRFTPLTFNMQDFKGIRWDWWSSGLKFSALLTRTRPGWTSKMTDDSLGTGNALVEYPITTSSFPSDYYMRGIKGDKDFSNKSPYGDYDLLWGLHAEHTIANKVDLGLTIINHHTNDIQKGVNPFTGNLPDSLMPAFIHFEFYDLTPYDTLDAGVQVEAVDMYVNGTSENNRVTAAPQFTSTFERAFVGDKDNVLLPRTIPLARPQNGPIPVVVEFATGPQYWQFVQGGRQLNRQSDIKKIYFKYKVAGNYLVFVSTDRQIPLSIFGTFNPLTDKVDYSHPSRSVGDIYDDGLTTNASPTSGVVYKEDAYSTSYFGNYIAESPKKISMRDLTFQSIVATNSWPSDASVSMNRREYTYEFTLNESAVTYGLNVRGELFGIKFNGEMAYDRAEGMLPGSEDSRVGTDKFAGTFHAERPVGKHFGVDGDIYYMSPEWKTNMSNLLVSQYFNQTRYKDAAGNVQDYQVYPRPLDHSWSNIDVNYDNDAFVESQPRPYPSDRDATNERGDFYNDGTMKADAIDPKVDNDFMMKRVTLPDGLVVPYDDPDGVVASRDDRNLNGIPDYVEDFLLYTSDPPVFELGIDLNNNGIPDYEDANLVPDFFREVGRSVGAVATGDGIRTLGIEGGKLNLRWTPFENTPLDVGLIVEGIVDRDFDPDKTAGTDRLPGDNDGRSQVAYVTFKREVLKRSQGLQYDFGDELRYVRDAIRNDVVLSSIERFGEQIDPHYYYYVDPLNYRNAIVDNLVGSVTYTNIRNFEYGVRAKIGGEYHLGLGDSVYSPRNTYGAANSYGSDWRLDENRAIGELDFVNRVQYRFKFNTDFQGWKSAFNFLNRLEIVPQYKFYVSYRRELTGPDTADPRDLEKDITLDYNRDGVINDLDNVGANLDTAAAVQQRWRTYSDQNYGYLLNAPIVRLDYKIAENTKLQLGYQWERYSDLFSPEDNYQKHTFLGQIVAKAQWKGYSVTFLIGGKYYSYKYDVNQRDPVTELGTLYDRHGYEFFAKLYSGI